MASKRKSIGFEQNQNDSFASFSSLLNDEEVRQQQLAPQEDSKELVLTEAHREELLRKSKELLHKKHREEKKSQVLNKLMLDHLNLEGSRSQADGKSLATYNEFLDRFHSSHKRNEETLSKISDSLKKATEERLQATQEMARLRQDFRARILQTEASRKVKAIAKLLDRSIKAHEKLSKNRTAFITAQNDLSEQQEKKVELDDIGEGIKMMDFENAETETQNLSSNIDNRTEKLDSLRQRLLNNEKKFKNARDKCDDVMDLIEEQAHELEMTKIEENQLRSNVKQLKVRKTELRALRSELLEDSGILTRVSLMRNFDDITAEIEELTTALSSFILMNEKLSNGTESFKLKIAKLKTQSSVRMEAPQQETPKPIFHLK